MIDIARLKIGDKVHYIKAEGTEAENGMVKEIPEDDLENIRVVYHCAGEWANFKNYTSALTPIKNLYKGWVFN